MKIGIEIRQIVMGVSGGITPLVKGVLEAAIRENPQHDYFIYTTIFNRGLLDVEGEHIRFFTLSIENFWAAMDGLAVQEGIDVLFRPYPGGLLKQYPMHKQVVLIPDIQHEHFPEFFDQRDIDVRREDFVPVLKHAGAIGTISEYAKRTLTEFPDTACKDIFLMPPAAQVTASDEPEAVGSEFCSRVEDIGPYFFFPANLWPHKNHKRLLEAFELYRKNSRRPVALILTGHPSGWEKYQSAYGHLPVHHFGFVSKAELRFLYRNAVALTFFSLYEGFGMPLLEAFDLGCPVICSNTTSLPEVGGDAVLSCDPTRVDEIALLMAEVGASDDMRQRLVAKGKSRLGIYTWESSAVAFMRAMERVGEGRSDSRVVSREPLVSIVTPSYNQGEFLQRTIESVLGQTYKNIEYIVMDGGSTDNSVEILRGYGDRFHWVSEPDGGQTDAINKGLEISKGEICAYLNSDDTLLPDTIERVVRYFRDNPNCDMVYGDANYIDVNDQVTGQYATAEYSFARLMSDCCVCQPAAFWTRDIALRTGPFDDRLNFVMDYDYWLRIDRAGGIIRYLPEVLANSRLYPETKTMSSRGQILKEIFQVTRHHGGYVHLNYFFALWHYRLPEKYLPRASLIRRTLKLWKLIAYLHYLWFNRSYCWVPVRRGGLRPFLRAGLRWYRLVFRNQAGGRVRAPERRAVKGFWLDNWFERQVAISSDNLKSFSGLYLVGKAQADGVLQVAIDDRPVLEQHLRQGRVTRLEIPSDNKATRLTLTFGNSQIDAANRELAFQVLATNLFSEADIQHMGARRWLAGRP